MPNYSFEGDENSLDDIRRDIAALQKLENAAILATRAIELRKYDRFVTEQEICELASEIHSWKNLLSRLQKALEDMTMNFPLPIKLKRGVYVGQLTDKVFVDGSSHYGHLRRFPGLGWKSWSLYISILQHLGVEPGSTPEGWAPPTRHKTETPT